MLTNLEPCCAEDRGRSVKCSLKTRSLSQTVLLRMTKTVSDVLEANHPKNRFDAALIDVQDLTGGAFASILRAA